MTKNGLRLEELAHRVREVGPERIAQMTGIKKGRVARFPNDPMGVTIPDLERIKQALRDLGQADV